MTANWKQYYVFLKQLFLWKYLKHKHASMLKGERANRIVIVPCDPEVVGGSRGDEAMIMASIHYYRTLDPSVEIGIVVTDQRGQDYIAGMGISNIVPLISWNGAYPLEKIVRSIASFSPKEVIILGADCMDGYYSPYLSLMLLSIYDLCHSIGLTTHLLGFSFNDTPSKLMIRAFQSLDADIRLRLRDAVSLKRYIKYTSCNADLVADAAFLLQPDHSFSEFSEIKKWVDKRKDVGDCIIGFNLHPMLKQRQSKEELQIYAGEVAKRMITVLEQSSTISFMLIPHDNRDRLTDNLMLKKISESLIDAGYKDRLYYNPFVFHAAQIKAICSLVDGLISSRMHLAIAALGEKKPIMVATYQGKFQGLFQHFNLDSTYVLSPEEFCSEVFVSKFTDFIKNLPLLEERISKELPNVIHLAKQNML